MLDKKLYHQIKSKNANRSREHAKTIGPFTWEQYRELKQVWHRIPNETEYDLYFFWCKRNGYDPEHIDYIRQKHKKS